MNRDRWGLLAGAALAAALAVLLLRAARGPGAMGPGAMGPDADAGPAADLFAEVPAPVGAAAPPAPAGGPALAGIVVDALGNPVAGAEVAAARTGERAPARVASGADGRFSLPVGAAGADYLVGVRAAGMAPVLRGGVRPGTGELRFVLHPPARLRGLVADGAGVPCAGARVRAVLRFPGVAKEIGGFETRADEGGRYAFEGFPPGDGTVLARFGDASSETVPFTIRPGEESVEADLRVDAGPALEGVVLDGGGAPLEGASVDALNLATGKTRATRTDAAGRFVLRGLEAVPHQVEAVDPRAAWLDPAPRRAVPPERALEIRMAANPEPPAFAVFRAVDGDGKPVPAVRTLAFRGGEETPTGSASLDADGSGLFRTGRLRPGRHRLDLRCAAGCGTSGEFAVEKGRTVDLGTIRLSPAATVRGRLLDAAGAPAAKARILADAVGVPEAGAVRPDGTFEVRGLPAGEGTLRARLPRCAELALPWRAAAGETADLGDLRFLPATGAFRGTVRSASGAPVAGAVVRLSPWDDFGPGVDRRRIAAGPDGRFEAPGLAAGRWVLSAEPPPRRDGKDAAEEPTPSFTSDRGARRIDLAEGEQAEVVLEIP